MLSIVNLKVTTPDVLEVKTDSASAFTRLKLLNLKELTQAWLKNSTLIRFKMDSG